MESTVAPERKVRLSVEENVLTACLVDCLDRKSVNGHRFVFVVDWVLRGLGILARGEGSGWWLLIILDAPWHRKYCNEVRVRMG